MEESKFVNKKYEELELNNLISYPKKSNNNLDLNFSLNEKEKECFSFILNILSKHNKTSTICRVVGGWVRDKLLGVESNDIDISLNDMEGHELARLINDEIYKDKINIGIIKQNEVKRKNMEIARIKVCDFLVDFIKIRNSPLFDAERRDISINSLFYNINEQKLEDLCQNGINDLKNGIIETPIEPEIALRLDPNILIRMLRFTLKYQFRISNKMNNCIEKNIEEYKKYLYNNTISRERIQKEFINIMSLNNSSFAIAYLYKFNLLESIMQPNKYISNNNCNFDRLFLFTCNLYIMGEYLYKQNIFLELNENNCNKIDLGFLLLTLNFKDIKDKWGTSLNKSILNRTFRVPHDIASINQIMIDNFEELKILVNKVNFDRLEVGKIMRKITSKNIFTILLASISDEYIKIINSKTIISELDKNILSNIIEKYKKFYNYLLKENLFNVDKLNPIITGKEIIKMFNVTSNLNQLKELLVEEQIKNPNITKEFEINFLNNKIIELNIPKNKKNIIK